MRVGVSEVFKGQVVANPGPGATQERYFNFGIPSKSFFVVAVTVS